MIPKTLLIWIIVVNAIKFSIFFPKKMKKNFFFKNEKKI